MWREIGERRLRQEVEVQDSKQSKLNFKDLNSYVGQILRSEILNASSSIAATVTIPVDSPGFSRLNDCVLDSLDWKQLVVGSAGSEVSSTLRGESDSGPGAVNKDSVNSPTDSTPTFLNSFHYHYPIHSHLMP